MADSKLTKEEMAKVQRYLRKTFSAPKLELRARARATDSAEVYLDGEFMALVTKDIEDGETCFQLNMSILDIDLDEA